ncbi:hypothetical protein [Serinicoccus marinus]|uniref:hypothetical protein n=1 Tax=Serinicoccus marinus TaxID=247333 RepID=UPI0024901683|nr:hypothetical protein [Serinicoccus marinus]
MTSETGGPARPAARAAADGLDPDSVPVLAVPSLTGFEPAGAPGASRYRHTLPGGEHVDALLVNNHSDVLVVTFHGALNRRRFRVPRFERARTTLQHDVSGLFIADPALCKHPDLELAWYTGWGDLDMHHVAADWAQRAARAVGATRIVLTGSSGGGFAALQSARFLPGSLAVPFNPQTSIYGYVPEGSYGAQRSYIGALLPEAAPHGIWSIDWTSDWTQDLGDRYSVLRSFSRPVTANVLYVDNVNDFHHEQHYLPFMAAVEHGGNQDRVRTLFYAGRDGHHPPNPDEFHAAMSAALTWVAQLPSLR